MGLLGYLSTFVSQYRGSGQPHRVGVAYQHAMATAWMIVPIYVFLILIAPWFFFIGRHSEELVKLEADYLRVVLMAALQCSFIAFKADC